MTKLYVSFALALGLFAGACVDEEEPIEVPPTQDEDETPGEVDPNVPIDEPGENVPGKGDCQAQLQDDDTGCTPK